MSKLLTMREAIADLVPDGASVALGLQMEQMIPFAAGHEIIRQKKRGLTIIGPISDILFDQIIAAGCVEEVIAAWVGNVMMGSAYNFRRAAEQNEIKVVNLTNFTVALALQAGAMGVPFLPTRTALGSDVAKGNEFFAVIASPFEPPDSRGDSLCGDGRPGKLALNEVEGSRPSAARHSSAITTTLGSLLNSSHARRLCGSRRKLPRTPSSRAATPLPQRLST